MKQEEQQYNGWIVSNNILKRSLAIWGHFFLGYLVVACTVGVVGMAMYFILSV